jgi:hypothetical protein
MESIYYSICWHCHRRCKHCYEERFHPYVREALEKVVSEAEAAFPRIVANLPERMTYLDRAEPDPEAPGGFREKTGRIILSGGEVLAGPVRERVLYPLLEALRDKYRGKGGVKVVVQTTGDLVKPQIVEDLLARGVWMISVAGMDDFHIGMEGDKKITLEQKLTAMFEAAGLRRSGLGSKTRNWHEEQGPLYSFFGATEDAWIGKIWPRGRAWQNGLSRAGLADNFCNAWSGGLNFLEHRFSGSEVAIDADGNLYPCCMKTKAPLGNLTEEPLLDILDSLAGHPAFEAINAGKPERMGLAQGWSVEDFLGACRTTTPKGQDYANLCIGCDRFHEAVLGPVIEDLRAARKTRRAAQASLRVAE